MMHPRWNECIMCNSIPGHEVGDVTYAIPEDLYNEIFYKKHLELIGPMSYSEKDFW